ncbi:class I SAM-dependent methyltransferase [Bacillus aquiflavi]|nr:class I SAM-dependent methyltransferase [Bacillus aquiflavi]
MNNKWNAQLYDDKHEFVTKYGERLIHLLNAQAGETILDIGCGTGDLANQIAASGAHIIGIDTSEEMIQQAKAKYPNLLFHGKNVTKLEEVAKYDAIFSNAALHWVKEAKTAVGKMFQVLKPGGRLIVELGGAGNIASIVQAIKATIEEMQLEYREDQFPWYFPTPLAYHALLEQAGFTVDTIELYDRPTELDGKEGLRNWLDMFSQSLLAHLTEKENQTVYDTTEKKLAEKLYHKGKWIADYRRLRVTARK